MVWVQTGQLSWWFSSKQQFRGPAHLCHMTLPPSTWHLLMVAIEGGKRMWAQLRSFGGLYLKVAFISALYLPLTEHSTKPLQDNLDFFLIRASRGPFRLKHNTSAVLRGRSQAGLGAPKAGGLVCREEPILTASDLGQSFPFLPLRLLLFKMWVLEWVLRKAISFFILSFSVLSHICAVFSLHMTIIKYTLAMHISFKEPESGRKSKKGNSISHFVSPAFVYEKPNQNFPHTFPRPPPRLRGGQQSLPLFRDPLSTPGPKAEHPSSQP